MTITTGTTDTTTTTDGTWVLADAAGREAVVCRSGQRITITAAGPDAFHTRADTSDTLTGDALVILPRAGEEITIDVPGLNVRGLWVGLETLPYVVGEVAFHALVNGHTHRYTAPSAATLDARTIAVRPATPILHAALTALAAQIHERQENAREHEARMDRLVTDAHTYADDNSLCERFDEFMEEHGLPRRVRDYSLRVEVTVYLTRSGSTVEDAIESIERSDVREAMDQSSFDFEVEQD